MRKRFLSLLLVLACVLTLAVMPVIAAESEPVQPSAAASEPTDCSHRADGTNRPHTARRTQPGAHAVRPVVSGGDGFCPRSRHSRR